VGPDGTRQGNLLEQKFPSKPRSSCRRGGWFCVINTIQQTAFQFKIECTRKEDISRGSRKSRKNQVLPIIEHMCYNAAMAVHTPYDLPYQPHPDPPHLQEQQMERENGLGEGENSEWFMANMKKTWKRQWVKLWIEILDDGKMGMLPNWLWRRAIELFLLAGENGNDGLLLPVADMAWRLRVPIEKLTESLQALSEVGVVHETPDGWLVTNFMKRQTCESYDRVRRSRERYRKEKCNGEVADDYS